MWKGKWKESEKEVFKEPERGKFVFKKPELKIEIAKESEIAKEIVELKEDKVEKIEKKVIKPIFTNINTLHIEDNPTKSMIFVLEDEKHINSVKTYHCGGVNPVGTLELVDLKGTSYGIWDAVIVDKLFWECYPNIDLQAGSYKVIDSNPTTWSWNGLSLGVGFTEIK